MLAAFCWRLWCVTEGFGAGQCPIACQSAGLFDG